MSKDVVDPLRGQNHGDQGGTASQKAVRGSVSEGVSRVPDSASHSCSHSPGQYLSLLLTLRHIEVPYLTGHLRYSVTSV